MTFAEKIAPALTLENAKAWQANSEKYLFMVDDIFDPLEVPVSDGRIDWVEAKFVALLADDAMDDFNYVGSKHHY